MRRTSLGWSLLSGTLLVIAAQAGAADDPSIQGDLRRGIQQSMREFLDEVAVGGVVLHYDPVVGELLRLKPSQLHEGIVRKGDFYVSCVDFVDERERTVDLDLLVRESGGEFRVTQALVHSVAGEKRPYQLEETAAPRSTTERAPGK